MQFMFKIIRMTHSGALDGALNKASVCGASLPGEGRSAEAGGAWQRPPEPHTGASCWPRAPTNGGDAADPGGRGAGVGGCGGGLAATRGGQPEQRGNPFNPLPPGLPTREARAQGVGSALSL